MLFLANGSGGERVHRTTGLVETFLSSEVINL